MHQQLLDLLDRSLTFSLWVFLLSFTLLLAWTSWRLRRQPGRGEGVSLHPSRQLRLAVRALCLALLAGITAFLTVTFTPLSPHPNFATRQHWTQVPLRLTQLFPDRTHSRLTLRGQVWNQSPEEISQLQVWVSLWDMQGHLLDEMTGPVSPRRLRPGQAGEFRLTYPHNSPFLYGYRVEFRDSSGRIYPHVKGYDVQR